MKECTRILLEVKTDLRLPVDGGFERCLAGKKEKNGPPKKAAATKAGPTRARGCCHSGGSQSGWWRVGAGWMA